MSTSFLGRSAMALSIMAALASGPAFAMQTPHFPDIRRHILSGGGGGKGKRKHRASGKGGRGLGNHSYNPPAFQGRRERMRRIVGGFALAQRVAGMTKAMCVRHLNAVGATPAEVREAVLA